MKELRNGNTLFTFNVTDFTDSMSMKMFAKDEGRLLKMLSQLADGKWVTARGRVEYDRFMQVPELVMMPNDLHEVKPPPERMDDAEEKRVEFHLHTTMSTMDAVTSDRRIYEDWRPNGGIKRSPSPTMAACKLSRRRPRQPRSTASR